MMTVTESKELLPNLAHSRSSCRRRAAGWPVTVVGFASLALLALPEKLLAQEPVEQLIDEVIVTAQKREQALTDVPISLTVFTGGMLERENIENTHDYLLRTPNVEINQTGVLGYRGAVGVTIRQVSGRTNFYLDETPIPNSNIRLFDIERIEVLRGPQSTLFGDVAMGGTIHVVTRKPSTEGYETSFATGYSFMSDGGDSYYVEGAVNLPISDRVAVRLTGYTEELAGYVDNIPPAVGRGDQTAGGLIPFDVTVNQDSNRGSRSGFRGSIRFEATDTLSIEASAFLQDVETDFRSFYDEPTPLQSSDRGKTFELQDLNVFNVTVDWKSGKFGVVSSSTYWENPTANTEDLTNFFGAVLGLPTSAFTNSLPLNNSFPEEALSHETRISFNSEDTSVPFYAVLGVFYEDKDSSRDQFSFDTQLITDINSAIDPDGSIGFDFGNLFDSMGVERGLWAFQQATAIVQQRAVFGEVTIQPTDWLELTAGLRYYNFDVSESRTTDGFLFQGLEVSSGSTKVDGVNPRFNIKANVNEDVFVYASAAEGFNIGSALGSALPSTCDQALLDLGLEDGPVDPESLWSYELGAKGQLLGGKLQLDGNVFYIDWTDIQESVVIEDVSCPENLLGNFGDAKIYGAEVSLSAIPFDNFRIDGAVGYSDSERSQAAIGVGASEQVGQQVLTVTINAQYSFPVGESLEGYVGADAQYIEEGKEDLPGTPHYSLANIRLGLVTEGGWEIALIGRNVFNSRPKLMFFPVGAIGTVFPQIGTLTPRVLGFEIRGRF